MEFTLIAPDELHLNWDGLTVTYEEHITLPEDSDRDPEAVADFTEASMRQMIPGADSEIETTIEEDGFAVTAEFAADDPVVPLSGGLSELLLVMQAMDEDRTKDFVTNVVRELFGSQVMESGDRE